MSRKIDAHVVLREDTPQVVIDLLYILLTAGEGRREKAFRFYTANPCPELNHSFFEHPDWSEIFMFSDPVRDRCLLPSSHPFTFNCVSTCNRETDLDLYARFGYWLAQWSMDGSSVKFRDVPQEPQELYVHLKDGDGV